MSSHELPNHDYSPEESAFSDREEDLIDFLGGTSLQIAIINRQINETEKASDLAYLEAKKEEILALEGLIKNAVMNNQTIRIYPDKHHEKIGEGRRISSITEVSAIVGMADGVDAIYSELVPDGYEESFFQPFNLFDRYERLGGEAEDDGSITIYSWTTIPGVSVGMHFPVGSDSFDFRFIQIDPA